MDDILSVLTLTNTDNRYKCRYIGLTDISVKLICHPWIILSFTPSHDDEHALILCHESPIHSQSHWNLDKQGSKVKFYFQLGRTGWDVLIFAVLIFLVVNSYASHVNISSGRYQPGNEAHRRNEWTLNLSSVKSVMVILCSTTWL